MCFSFVIRKVREKAAKRDKRQSEGEGRGEEGRVLFPFPLVFMFDLVFSLLSRFVKCAGLKVNVSKSEMLWLGSMRHRKDGVLDLKIRDEPPSTLQERFFFRTMFEETSSTSSRSYKNTLKSWSPRDISVYRRITIVKTLALFKVTFFCSSLEIPSSFC